MIKLVIRNDLKYVCIIRSFYLNVKQNTKSIISDFFIYLKNKSLQ